MEKEKRTEEAIQVFRKMLVEEFGIKSTEQFFSTEGEDMAVIYESMKVEQENFNLTDEETNAVLDLSLIHIFCTRPSDQTPRPAATASACEALIPTIQSASLRALAER